MAFNLSRLLALFLLCLVYLPHHSHGLMFRLAPHAMECLGVSADKGDFIVGSFDILPDTKRAIKVQILRDGKEHDVLYEVSQAVKGAFNVTANHQTSGVSNYRLCFTNEENYWLYVGFAVRTADHDRADIATTDSTQRLTEQAYEMVRKLQGMSDQQEYTLRHEEMHRDTAEAMNSRIVWWSSVQALAVLLTTMLQVWYMRSFFEVKTIV